ncbi:MAG TPA: hypothetical protein VKB80_35985, partial [Kofleriaceae bacterium]|nr:hypothetical protein [Kofleriaceae bacterium]
MLLALFHGQVDAESDLSIAVRRGLGMLRAEFRAQWFAWAVGPADVQRHKRSVAAALESSPAAEQLAEVRLYYERLVAAAQKLVATDQSGDEPEDHAASKRFAERIGV